MSEESAQQPAGELRPAPAANRRASLNSATKAQKIQPAPQQSHKSQQIISGKDNKKQWFLLILAAILLFMSLILTAYTFSITRDWRGFIPVPFIALPTEILRRLYLYYFPPSVEEYRLKTLKLRLKFEASLKRRSSRNDKIDE